jgi:hypothetical protein
MRRNLRGLASFILLLFGALAHADEPVEILVSNDSTTVAGVAYKTPAAAMAALKRLNPKEVRFVLAPEVTYESVSAALEAYQKSGIDAFTGFVGNVRE